MAISLMTLASSASGKIITVDSIPEDDNALTFSATVRALASSGKFAPYMIGSWDHGRTTAKNSLTLDLEICRPLDLSKRFSWSVGLEAITGYSHKASYDLFDESTNNWTTHRVGPAPIWLQQLYGLVKYRGVFLSAGMKNTESLLVDNSLSSGDLVQSNNARPIPMVTMGFVDFQDIPFTNGWVQIEGQIGYGKFADNDYLDNQYNRYNTHLTTGELYTYKRAYFRTNPAKPLSITIGAQSAGQFGGSTKFYSSGKNYKTIDNPQNLKAFWEMFIPGLDNGDGFVEGSHLGSWDFKARYRFQNSSELSAYFSWIWEDGSSMAKRNKWDGLWGLQWNNPSCSILNGAVVEYIDFYDQSGPIHWAPSDYPGTTITTEATGADDYYNNTSFNAHANYGMAIGNPFVMSPLYNLDGFPQFAFNRTRGFHLAAKGYIIPDLEWQAKVSYAIAYGNDRIGWPDKLHNTSAGIKLKWNADIITRGLSIGLDLALDRGALRGNNFGSMLTFKYSGILTSQKH